ncbi:MAG: hypothetical protein ACR2MZ_02770 [Candidatus Dormibacter sp.]|nr:MAG: hypothetical protein DLM66_10595 [Candidatus Dormibacteraeota bacterium]
MGGRAIDDQEEITVAGIIALLLLTGSLLGVGPLSKSADQYYNEAKTNFDRAAILKETNIRMAQPDGTTLTGEIELNRKGDAVMTRNLKAGKEEVMLVRYKPFVRGDRALWESLGQAKLAKALARRWVVSHDSTLGLSIADFISAGEWDKGTHSRTDLKKNETKTINGRAAIRLSDSSGEFWVTTQQPTQVMRLRTTGPSAISFDLSYPSSFSVAAPADAIDPADPTSLPAYYRIVAHDSLPPCDPAACRLGEVVTNDYGNLAPGDRPKVTIMVSRADNHQPLGQCTTDVPVIVHGESVKVSCVVASQALIDYANSGQTTFYHTAVITNPFWDDGRPPSGQAPSQPQG